MGRPVNRWGRPVLLAAALVAAALPAPAQERPDGGWLARGVVEPTVEATLSSGIAGRIDKLPVDRGMPVAAGDLLVAFDCAIERARLKAAQAELDGARAREVSMRRLDKLQSVGRLEVDLAAAASKKAAAAVEEQQAVLRFCTITAPYDGLVVDVAVHADESVDAGAPLLSILDSRSLRLVLLAPSDWVAWLAPGQPLEFTVDETGERLAAEVSHLGARIDATSQTLAVFATIRRDADPQGPPLLAGMTGTARFERP